MEVPLEIAFHNTESSEWAENEIRARVSDLERLYGRLVSCRVRVDQRAKDLAGTIPPVVHIELGIPGRTDLVVSHEPDHLQRKYKHPDLRKAINQAFRIARNDCSISRGSRKAHQDVHHDAGKAVAQPDRRDRQRRFQFLRPGGVASSLLPP